MEVIKMLQVPAFITPYGFAARKLLEVPSFTIINLLLKPGEVVEKHSQQEDAIFFVIKGSGRIAIGDEEEAVGEMDIVFSPKNTPRGIHASPDEEFHVLIIRSPLSAK